MKILLLEDEPSVLDFLERTFVMAKTFSAKNGKDALEIINNEQLDGAVIDLMLPDMDGMEVLKALHEKNPKAVIAIASAKNDPDTISKALRFGALEFLTKPYGMMYLREFFLKNIDMVKTPKYKDIEKPKILICDDEIGIHNCLKGSIVHKFISDVDIAIDGDEAVKKCGQKQYDIICMDINMPGINGIDAIKTIKRINPGTDFIVISGISDVQVTTQCLELGVLDFLKKPIVLDIFLARIKKALIDKDKFIPKHL